MPAAIDALSMAMSGTLLWAGLEKCRNIEGIAAAIRDLGIGTQALAIGLLVAAVEIALALGLIFAPAATAVQLGVALLAALFAASGAWALATGRLVRCNCFGSTGNQRLGTAQLWALIPWLGAVAILHAQASGPASASEGFLQLAIVALALAGVRAAGAVQASHGARGDRLSATEMLKWLP